MKRHPLSASCAALGTLLVLAGVVSLSTTSQAQNPAAAPRLDRCATPTPTAQRQAQVDAALQTFRANLGRAAVGPITVPIQFIHLTSGGQGQISESQRLQQTQILNEAYARFNVRFVYNSTCLPPVVEENSSWFNMRLGSQAERQCKAALQANPQAVLNFYTADGGGNLGWATFPDGLAANPTQDGVVCNYRSLPGGSLSGYDEGDTGTHEVGHWLGLYHTFQGGCSGQGDSVADTIAHSSPNYECTDTSGACTAGQSAPVTNFMNYTEDACMNRFTNGQGDRLLSLTMQYRSGLNTGNFCGTGGNDGGGGGGGGGDGGGGSGCALMRAADALLRWVPQSLGIEDLLDDLRDFRDQVLLDSEPGRALAQMYYANGPQLAELMISRPVETVAALTMLNNLRPELAAATEDGTLTVRRASWDECLESLADWSSAADPDLAAQLQIARRILINNAVVGETEVVLRFANASDASEPQPTLAVTVE